MGRLTAKFAGAVASVAVALALPALGWAWSLSTQVAVLQVELVEVREHLQSSSKRVHTLSVVLHSRLDVCFARVGVNSVAIAHVAGMAEREGN